DRLAGPAAVSTPHACTRTRRRFTGRRPARPPGERPATGRVSAPERVEADGEAGPVGMGQWRGRGGFRNDAVDAVFEPKALDRLCVRIDDPLGRDFTPRSWALVEGESTPMTRSGPIRSRGEKPGRVRPPPGDPVERCRARRESDPPER